MRSQIILDKVEQIAERARKYPQSVFTTLCHHINVELLTDSFFLLKRDSAAGIDRMTWRQYKKELQGNLTDLHQRLKSGRYQAQPSRRVWIEKEDGRKRPIAVSALEDKIVERAEVTLLEAVYEQDFLGFSYGFRKGRNQHQALKYFRDNCMGSKECWILDLDLKGYFDSIDHELLIGVLRKRVNDGGLLRLILKRLEAGVVEDGTPEYSDTGSPQGSVLSPMLSNIFLHTVIDEWFEREVKPALKGRCIIVRYADDIIVKGGREDEVKQVYEMMLRRLSEFKLQVNEQKTKLVRFCNPTSDQEAEETPTIDLLGFTHYWGKTRYGGWTIKRRTMRKRLRRAMTEIWRWNKKNRHCSLEVQHRILSAKLNGHYNYYGIRCNCEQMDRLYYFTVRTWLWWLKRRTNKHGLNWDKFNTVLSTFPLPTPRIKVSWV